MRPASPSDLSDDELRHLGEGMRAGKPEAFEALFRALYGPLVRFATPYTQSREAAEEVVQEVMLAVWAKREAFPAHISPAAYFYAAVRNRALNARAHDRRVQSHAAAQVNANATSHAGSDHVVFANDLAKAAHTAIEALPPRLREVYRLRRDQGLDNTEVAHVLGITAEAVRVRMTRALQALHVALAPWIK